MSATANLTAPTARSVALDLYRAVVRDRKPLDDALAQHPALDRLAPRDRAFARNIVSTALRRHGQIEALLDACIERPLPSAAIEVRDALALGAAQLLFLKTPAHAAVGETVSLVARSSHSRLKGLANAVLRRLDREGAAMLARQDDARHNTPAWLWRSWQANYGEPTARAIATAHLAEPPLDITVKRDPSVWAERLGGTVLPTGNLRIVSSGSVADLPGFDEGAWWVQDAAAALPVKLLGDVAGKPIIDLCAAPGGKTAQIAAAGGRVIAVDRSAKRLERLAQNLKRLDLQADTVVADGASWQPPEPADAVLLDAPCTATGTIRRHPDIAILKQAADVAKLSAVQDRLLDAAATMLKPGGVLVYCTCSLEPEEGPARIASFLDRNKSFIREPLEGAEIDVGPEFITSDGDLRTLPCHWPDRGGLDGFYAARLRRV